MALDAMLFFCVPCLVTAFCLLGWCESLWDHCTAFSRGSPAESRLKAARHAQKGAEECARVATKGVAIAFGMWGFGIHQQQQQQQQQQAGR